MSDRPVATLQQQADLIDMIATYCERDEKALEKTWVLLRKSEAEDLRALANRLRRMAPFENDIREIVTRR